MRTQDSCGPRYSPRPACRGPAGSRSRSAGGATSTAGWPRRSRCSEALAAGRDARARAADAPVRRAAAQRDRASRDWFIERHLGRLNPALVGLYRRRVAEYEVLVEDIGRRSARGERGAAARPRASARRPARRASGQLERRSAVLAEAAADAERLVEAALSTGTWMRAAPAA